MPDDIREFRANERAIPGIRVGSVRTKFHAIQSSIQSTLLSPEQMSFVENLNALGTSSQQSRHWPCLSQLSQASQGNSQDRQLSPMVPGFSQGSTLDQTQPSSDWQQVAMMPSSNRTPLRQIQEEELSQAPSEFAVVPGSNRVPPEDDFWLSQPMGGSTTPRLY